MIANDIQPYSYGIWTGSGTCVALSSPVNDNCVNATLLPCETTDLVGATINCVSESSPSGCASNYGVWYTFTGDGNSTTISSTATFDHEMDFFYGNCGSLTNISCIDNSTLAETYTLTTTVGVQYYIYLAHWSTSSITGTFTISRSCSVLYNPCATIYTVSCGTAYTATISSGTGTYNTASCGYSTPGIELICSFTPTITSPNN